MAPSPPGVSTVPVAVSVIRAYFLSVHGKSHQGFGHQLFPKINECIHGWFRQRASFVAGVFPGEFEQQSGNDSKALDVHLEEVAEPHE